MDRRRLRRALTVAAALAVLPGAALAHGGGLAGSRADPLAIPAWLFLLTGGAVVGASFLLASFVTDRRLVGRFHAWSRPLPAVPSPAPLARAAGLAGLAVVLVAGLAGPLRPLDNAAVLLVWAGWWAGYPITVYAGGNSWPSLDPFRALAAPLGDGRVDYPERLGAWPAVAGLLALVWLEVVNPLASDPRLLAAAAALYGAVALAGAAILGRETWFERVDPLSAVFRQYGRVAPLRVGGGESRLTLPGAGLVAPAADRSEVGLVVAVVWGATFDGLVGTPLWRDVAVGAVGAGVPPWLLYPAALVAGYAGFLGVFLASGAAARRLAPTYLAGGVIARAFAPSLLAIAAGYHLAHYLGYFLSLAPVLAAALASPLSATGAAALSLPGWLGAVPVAAVLLGHLLAVWVAHAVAYDRFPGRLQAIRGQYPVTAVMVVYTMVSLWIVTRPAVAPPYV